MDMRLCPRLLVSLLAMVGALAAEAAAPKVEVVIDAPQQAATVSLTLTASSRDQLTLRTVLKPGEGRAVLELPGEGPWRVRAEGEGVWGEESVVSTPAPLRLRVWEASGIRGELKFPKGARLPPEIAVELLPADESHGDQVRQLLVSFPLEPEGLLSCQLPAGRWHIRLAVPGMVSHPIPAALLPPGTSLDLGQIQFAWGLELTGRVVGLGDEEQRSATQVKLYLGAEGGISGGEGVAEGSFVRQTTLDASGTFRFGELSPAVYWLSVQHPSCPPTRARVLVSGEDPCVELPEPLVLTCGARLTVTVNPPDAVREEGLLVYVLGEQPPLGFSVLARGTLLPGETWVSPLLAPGDYLLELRDSEEDEGAVAARGVSLGAEDLAVEFSLARLAVSGRLLLGRRPTAGVIHLSHADSGARLQAAADSGGRFSVIVPAAGRWTALVELRRPTQFCPAGEVEIAPGRPLEIRLPDGRVSGRVVHPDGSPVENAGIEITAEHLRPAGTTSSAKDGSFLFRALANGRYTLTAEKGARASRQVELALGAGGEVSVILVLEEQVSLRCRINSAYGPVANAEVFVAPLNSSATLASHTVPTATTDREGLATISLPPDSVAARFYVMAAGFAFRVTGLLPLPPRGETLDLTLSSQGGTLVLPQRPGGALESGQFPVLMVDDAPVDVAMLPQWSFLNGRPWVERDGAFQVPRMPPGHYQLCQLTSTEALLVWGGLARPKPAACVGGRLEPGGVLVLGVKDPTAAQ